MKEESKRRALGRGLEELFSIEDINYGNLEEKIMETVHEEEIQELPLSELRVNPYQPRKTFNEESLNELAESIKEHGVFQPIIVKKSIKGYEIVAGERRFRASKLAGKETIPAIVRNFTDEEMMEIALLENIQREDLNPVDTAISISNILQVKDMTQEEFSKKFGKSRSYITNLLGLLNLPKSVQELVKNGKLSMSHARCLSKIDDEEKVINLANKIIKENLNVRDIEKMLSKKDDKKVIKEKNEKFRMYEDAFSDTIGNKVRISNKKIEISYNSMQDLNRIMEILNINFND